MNAAHERGADPDHPSSLPLDRRHAHRDPERHFNHVLALFSVSAGMIGVDLTGIGLVQLVTQSKQMVTICDDLLVIDAALFGFVSLLCYHSLRSQVRQQHSRFDRWIDEVFLVAQVLMVFVCGLFAWSVL